jgi:hypothetical protein
MSKAAELASLASASETALSNRNIVINGAMQVAQRGTSSTTANAYLVDRFKTFTANTDQLAFTQAQVADGPDGFSHSYKFTTTTAESALASDESVKVRQTLEGQNVQQLKYGLSSAEQITLSFYVKGSVTGAYSITANQTVDPWNLVGSTYIISSANTWEKKIITFPANTLTSIANNTSGGIYFDWHISAGSANTGTDNSSWGAFAQAKTANGQVAQPILTVNSTWQLTGVQMEVGPVATPFEHRSYGQELALCQRYYQTINPKINAIFAAGYQNNSERISQTHRLGVEMRIDPTCTVHGTWNVTGCDQPVFTSFSKNVVATHILKSGGAGSAFYYPDGTGDYFSMDAEL